MTPPWGMNQCSINNCQHEKQTVTYPVYKAVHISALKQNGLLQSLSATPGGFKESDVTEEVLRVREEWDAVANIHPGETVEKPLSPIPLISFNEALQYFQTADLSDCRKKIRPTIQRRGLAAMVHFLFGPPRLHQQLQSERDLALAIAQWMDPGTDLRGAGLLGLMQTLYFVMDSRILPVAREIFKLSHHEVQNFPFCVMSVNITRIVIQVLREERLSRECNRRQQVIAVLNDLYVAVFLRLFNIWKTQRKTISDSGFVLKELEAFAKRNPKQLLRHVETFMNGSSVAGGDDSFQAPAFTLEVLGPNLSSVTIDNKELNFASIGDLLTEKEDS
ncbi:ELMO domain-containing protein 3 isoform 2-T2 [Liasis olivaceus]